MTQIQAVVEALKILGGVAENKCIVGTDPMIHDASNIATAEIDIRGLKGDVNADGEVNVADLVTTTNIIMGKDE